MISPLCRNLIEESCKAKRQVVLAVYLFADLQPFQVKLTAGEEDQVQTVVTVYRIQRKGECLGGVTVREFNDLVNDGITSIGWRKAHVDGVCLNVGASVDGDVAEAIPVKMHIVKFHSDIISDVADRISVKGKHISSDITAVGSVQFCIGFLYFGKIEALQGHFHIRINNDGNGLDAFQAF